MSHTSSQSSHNPSLDLGPESDAVWQALQELNDRIKVLEHANPMPMLLDLSTRLEALEDSLAKQAYETTQRHH